MARAPVDLEDLSGKCQARLDHFDRWKRLFRGETTGTRCCAGHNFSLCKRMAQDSLSFPDALKIFSESEQKKVKPLQIASSDGRPRVLLGEDDPVHSLTLHHFLTQAGYDVFVAVTGTGAITELRKADHPAVAILSTGLPEMSGLEICKRMRDADKDVYVIVYRDRPTSAEIIAGLDAGADLVLPKSVPPEELLAHVKVGSRIIGRQQAMAQRIEEISGKRF
jgi:CheY-like chemotaxis protein